MKSIYGSKLFIASKRKEQIKAALLAEANSGLVQQLAEDLDEQYQTPENLGEEEEKPADNADTQSEDNKFNDFIVDEEIDPKKDLVTVDDLGNHSGSSSNHKPKHDSDKSSDNAAEPSEESSKSDTSELMPESPGNDQTEASINLDTSKESVKAKTVEDLNIFKNTLNLREDTSGVIRVAEKDDEIWIYYNDDVNLNDVMVSVIESIGSIDHDNLEFNRLARSDNAVVFVTNLKQTHKDVDSAAKDS